MAIDRRTFLNRSAATGAGVALAGGAGVAAAAPAEAAGHHHPEHHPKQASLRVLGTTDVHGHVLNWDYFTNAEYDDATHNDVGLAKVATLVEAAREEKGRHRTLLVDAGDIIQGTQLSYYYARVDPITGGRQTTAHPPDGAGDEPHEVRRRRARQPRVQLRHPGAAGVRGAVRLPAARGQRAGRQDPQARLPALRGQADRGARRPRHQGRHPRPDQPRHRGLGQGQRPGEDDLLRTGRAGEGLRAQTALARLRRGLLHRPLRPGRQHHLRRRGAVPGERLVAGRRSRSRASTRSWWATRTSSGRAPSS